MLRKQRLQFFSWCDLWILAQNFSLVRATLVVAPSPHHFNALTITAKSSAFNDAPPISPPSTSGWANISAAFWALQDPPYKMVVESATDLPYFLATSTRMAWCISWACALVAVLPVPMAQMGSYAMITLRKSSSRRWKRLAFNCLA